MQVFTTKVHGFLPGNTDFLLENTDFLTKTTAFPLENTDFLTKTTDFPLKNTDFLSKNDDCAGVPVRHWARHFSCAWFEKSWFSIFRNHDFLFLEIVVFHWESWFSIEESWFFHWKMMIFYWKITQDTKHMHVYLRKPKPEHARDMVRFSPDFRLICAWFAPDLRLFCDFWLIFDYWFAPLSRLILGA